MSAVLSGQVDFNSIDQFYTYSYSIQNDTPSTIWNVDLFVGPTPQGMIQPIPAPYTAPSGWTMYGSFSGSIASPPYSMLGGFYEFYGNGDAIQPQSPASGFSIVTPYAPTSDNSANDFFLYGSQGIVAYGNVVVPSGADWMAAPPPWMPPPGFVLNGVPEPATWLLLLIGFIVLAIFHRKGHLTDSNTMLG